MSGGEQTQQSGPPEWAAPYYKAYFDRAGATADLPYQPYTGQRQADMNPATVAGLNATAERAIQGAPEIGQARTQLGNTLGGGYLGYQAPTNASAGAFNPYAAVQNASAGAFNPYAGVRNNDIVMASSGSGGDGGFNEYAKESNKFAGANPYLSQMIDASSSDVLRNYNTAVKPQTEAAMANSGSFGNSGLAEMQRNQQSDLQKNLGNLSNQYRFQDYTTQQQMDEARLGRMYGAGQQQVQNRFQAGENAAGRGLQAGMQYAQNRFNAGENQAQRLFGAGQQQAQNIYGSGENMAQRLYGAGNQYAQNQYSAGENLANRQDNAYQAERGRQLGAIGYAPTLAAQDYTDAQALMGVGNAFRANEQGLRDQDYANFLEARNYPREQLQTLSSAFGANPGTTSTTSTKSNPWNTAIGVGSLMGGGK